LTDEYNDQILRLTTDGTFTGFPLHDSDPIGIVTGPDKALWFTNYSDGAGVGRITTSGKITMYAAGPSRDIAVGADGALWCTESQANQIGRVTTRGKISGYSKGITSGSEPYSIAPGPDGALWFTEYAGGRIARITTSGKVTEYSRGITPSEHPIDLAAGPDNAMWFTEYEVQNSSETNAKIGRITMDGKITEYSGFDSSSEPTGIVAGLQGDMWFVESATDRLGRFSVK
jgi:virginiamycin B lyase